jgi:hypothetical protein
MKLTDRSILLCSKPRPAATEARSPTLPESLPRRRRARLLGVTWVTGCDLRHCAQPQGVAPSQIRSAVVVMLPPASDTSHGNLVTSHS